MATPTFLNGIITTAVNHSQVFSYHAVLRQGFCQKKTTICGISESVLSPTEPGLANDLKQILKLTLCGIFGSSIFPAQQEAVDSTYISKLQIGKFYKRET